MLKLEISTKVKKGVFYVRRGEIQALTLDQSTLDIVYVKYCFPNYVCLWGKGGRNGVLLPWYNPLKATVKEQIKVGVGGRN